MKEDDIVPALSAAVPSEKLVFERSLKDTLPVGVSGPWPDTVAMSVYGERAEAVTEVVVGYSPATTMFTGLELLPPKFNFAAHIALTECAPIPSTTFIEAVPLAVTCAWPSKAGPWHLVAVALQKLTRPGVTGMTVAVKVTGVGHVTDAEDTVSVVAEFDSAQSGALAPKRSRQAAMENL
jgi:hypothetical protein